MQSLYMCNSCGENLTPDALYIRKDNGTCYCDECWGNLDGEFPMEENNQLHNFIIEDTCE